MSDTEKKFKRYMVFGYYDYYPSGGIQDCKDSFDTLEEAITFVVTMEYKPDHIEILDRKMGVVVRRNK